MLAATLYWYLVSFAFGALMGSFLFLVAERVPAGRTIHGRSACPGCSATLEARDVFPVLGYLRLRGRCRTCGMIIPRRYLVIELVAGLTAALLMRHFVADFRQVSRLELGQALLSFGVIGACSVVTVVAWARIRKLRTGK